MRARHYCWVFLFLVLSLLFNYANASDYYWKNTTYNIQADSPETVCSSVGPVWLSGYSPSSTFQSASLFAITTSTTAQCSVTYVNTAGNTVTNSSSNGLKLSRFGDSCPAGTIYNTATGACENPCAAKAGTFDPFTKSGTAPDGYMTLSDNWSAPVQSGCFGGCLASTADQKCTTKVSGLYLCRGKAWYTGAQCQTEPTVESSETPDYPLPQTITENEPCNYVTQADGTQTCQSKQSEEKEGQNCGEVNGERLCLDTQPTKNGIDISTEVATVDNPDGSKTTTKTDTATSTKCTAMNLCASTSTTVTTTTQTDANGDTTSTTGSCTGAQCPDDNTNPDGNGDGLGDCIEECGDGEGGGQDWYEPVEDTYASVLEDFTGRVSQAPAVAGVSDFLTFAPNGSCPTWSVEVWVFHVVIDQLCDNSIPWALVAAVIMGTAAFLSFRIAFL